MQALHREAPPAVWDSLYEKGSVPWQSSGLSDTTAGLLTRYAPRARLLEVGCGLGMDVLALLKLGFEYAGLDISAQAIRSAQKRFGSQKARFLQADFLRWSTEFSFDAIYDKGFFHGLAGMRRRNAVVRRIAAALRPGGIWVTVCGSADRRRVDFCHGAIYLRDLVAPAEVYFEVLEVVKSSYGLAHQKHDFDAWHAAFRRR